MNIEKIRSTFPHIKEEKIYFNHAAIGPLSTTVAEKLQNYIYLRSTTIDKTYDIFLASMSSLKNKLSQLLNCKSYQIAFSENVSMGLNLLAQGLTWQPGDEIILNDLEFPSNVYPFLNLEKKGVKVKFVKSSNGVVDSEDYEKLITPRTKLISISLVQFLSGYKANIKALGEICKQKNIIFVVDGIQGAGVVECDVEAENIDFFVGGAHKWLMALTGVGYFYISDDLLDKVDNANLGWTSVTDPWNLLDYNPTPRNNADRFQTGTMNSIGIVALDATLDLFLSSGIKNIQGRIQENSYYFLNSLKEKGFSTILNNCPKESLAGITSIKIDNADKIFKELENKKITASTREGMLRFAPHFYNTKEEIDEVINNLKELDK